MRLRAAKSFSPGLYSPLIRPTRRMFCGKATDGLTSRDKAVGCDFLTGSLDAPTTDLNYQHTTLSCFSKLATWSEAPLLGRRGSALFPLRLWRRHTPLACISRPAIF